MLKIRKGSFSDIFIKRFSKNVLGKLSLWLILAMMGVAVFAPFIANDTPLLMSWNGKITLPFLARSRTYRRVDWSNPSFHIDWAIYPLVRFSPIKTNLRERLQWPSLHHPFGTDDNGMDVFARVIWGTRISLTIGILAAIMTLVIGTAVGALAGYMGGRVDIVLSRFIEMMMCFPTFFLILTVLAFLPPSIYNIIVVLGLTGWTSIARLVRGEVLKTKRMDYIRASRLSGTSTVQMLFRHIIPNSMTPALISATFTVSGAILVESTLSFLGLGVQPPTASWGAILEVAQRYIQTDKGWWLAFFPGVAIFLTVSAYNLFGQAVRDAADPKTIE